MSLHEVTAAADIIRETSHPEVNLIFGAVVDDKMDDELRITVIATGFDQPMTSTRTAPQPSQLQKPRRIEVTDDVQGRSDDLDIPAFMRKHYK